MQYSVAAKALRRVQLQHGEVDSGKKEVYVYHHTLALLKCTLSKFQRVSRNHQAGDPSYQTRAKASPRL